MNTQHILVTGSAGRIGRAVVKALLARGYQVRGFDRVPTPDLESTASIVGELTDPNALRQAATGVQSVIHLAATPDDARFPRGQPPNDGDNFLSELLPSNIIGAYHLLETARILSIPRLILASTGQVVDGYLRDQQLPVTVSLPPRPRYLYACTKVFLEALGQAYADQHGLTVLVVRLGWCPRPGQIEEIRASRLGQDLYLSPGDAGRFFTAAVEAATLPRYAVVYAASHFTHRMAYDLGPAERLLGYVPQDRWPIGAEDF
jgi:nucleoside-diphosphate-sugar epimerase